MRYGHDPIAIYYLPTADATYPSGSLRLHDDCQHQPSLYPKPNPE